MVLVDMAGIAAVLYIVETAEGLDTVGTVVELDRPAVA